MSDTPSQTDFGFPHTPNPRRGRGAGKSMRLRHITIRIPGYVVDHYNGDLKAMRDAWVVHVEKLISESEVTTLQSMAPEVQETKGVQNTAP